MKIKAQYIVISLIFIAYSYTKEREANNMKSQILNLEKQLDRTALDWDACKYFYCDLWNAKFIDTTIRHKKLGEYVCDE